MNFVRPAGSAVATRHLSRRATCQPETEYRSDELRERKDSVNEQNAENWSRSELLEVARGQRRIIRLILFGLALALGYGVFMAFAVVSERDAQEAAVGARWLSVGFGIVQLVNVWRLAMALRSSVPWLYCVLGFVPVVAVFSLLVLNQNATKVLQTNGIRVGFLGANLADFGKLSFGPDECGLCGRNLKNEDEVLECGKCRIDVCHSCAVQKRQSAGMVESFSVTCPKCGTELSEVRNNPAAADEPEAEDFDKDN